MSANPFALLWNSNTEPADFPRKWGRLNIIFYFQKTDIYIYSLITAVEVEAPVYTEYMGKTQQIVNNHHEQQQ